MLGEYLGALPLIPALVVAVRWRALHARFAFYSVGLVLVAGVSFLLQALVAGAEAFVFGSMSAHPQTALWRILRFEVPSYGAALISLLLLWRLSQNWTQFVGARRGDNHG
jgi:hypothetical protein